MFLKVKIECPCNCSYTANENISTSKITCPNCGKDYPYYDKLISLLNLAKEIPDGELFGTEHTIKVISASEDMSIHQQ